MSDEHLEHELDLGSDPEVTRYLGAGRSRTRDEIKRQHLNRLALIGWSSNNPHEPLLVGYQEDNGQIVAAFALPKRLPGHKHGLCCASGGILAYRHNRQPQ